MEINVNVCVVRSIFRYAIEIGNKLWYDGCHTIKILLHYSGLRQKTRLEICVE